MGGAAWRLTVMARRTLTFVTGNPNKLEEVSRPRGRVGLIGLISFRAVGQMSRNTFRIRIESKSTPHLMG